MVQPQAIVTLKVADERDRVMWVEEPPSAVLARIQDAREGRTGTNVESPMIKITAVRGMEPHDFWTRFDNVANVQAYR